MILQALSDYYLRKGATGQSDLAPPGYESKEIPFIFEIDETGGLIQVEDTREPMGKKKIARRFLVPQAPKKSVNVAASLFWGNVEYVLGYPDPKKLVTQARIGKEERYRWRLSEMHAAFVDAIEALSDQTKADLGVVAVLRFLQRLNIGALEQLPHWAELVVTNSNLTFRLRRDTALVCQRSAVRAVIETVTPASVPKATCIVTGDIDEIERLHPSIKGVWGAQTSGANIVSFNLDSFNSYGRIQGANAPVGKRVAFAYTTALNHLLAKDSKQRLQVADASTVFWAEKPTFLETAVVDIFGEPTKDDPDRGVRAVRSLYESVRTGVSAMDSVSNRFYVLGLAPNAARIAVKSWHVSTVAELADHICRHFDDLSIVHSNLDPPYLSMFRLLIATATLGKTENIQPSLAGDLMRSILAGTPYPRTLLQATVRRVRAEQARRDRSGGASVTYARAAIIKACLNRDVRFHQLKEKELKVSLDEHNLNPAYRLGRLFAVLEKIQEEASPGINATIRDRFYGAAASTPVSVFSTLLKLKNHHLAKMENRGRVVNFEKLVGEIVTGINDFPAQMGLADQGRFAIGYYHQRQSFYTKSETSS